ncbi:MAG: hypothetical protein GEU98_29090 [Pseudonocardiaceae bacterium]|nr:hypothetical protein [Pseudonocardiaceae bacterium]
MNEGWLPALGEQVKRYLAYVERLAGQIADTRGVELRRLVGAWRALLEVHAHSRRGRCRGCRRGRQLCTVWWVANAYFVRRLQPGEEETFRRFRH